MATLDFTAPKSFNTALEELFDVLALIECAESQLENDGGNPAVRILHIAFDKLKEATDLIDNLASKKTIKPA